MKFNQIGTCYGEKACGLGFLTLLPCNVLCTERKISLILMPVSSSHDALPYHKLATDDRIVTYISCLENVSNPILIFLECLCACNSKNNGF